MWFCDRHGHEGNVLIFYIVCLKQTWNNYSEGSRASLPCLVLSDWGFSSICMHFI